MQFAEIKQEILKAKKIGLAFHVSPDGDALGSTLGLLKGLRYLNKEAYVICRDVIADNFSYIAFSEEVDGNTFEIKKDTDLIITLDCGNVERLSVDLTNYTGKVINIDHHVSNENFGDINFVDASAAATCELSYLLMKELGIDFESKNEDVIEIGNAIYTGIVTDTGSFRHSNVTKRTHNIAAELIDMGVNNSKIHSNLFDNKPFEKIKLMGSVLTNIELVLDNKVAVLEVNKKMLEDLNISNKIDTSDIISIGLGIKGVEVSMLLKEADEGIKTSLRSKNDVDVRNVAEVFGGGGHVKASGVMQRNVTMDEAKANLIKALKEEMQL